MTMPKIVRNLDGADRLIRDRTPFQTRARATPYGDFISMSGVTADNRYVRDVPDARYPGEMQVRPLHFGHLPDAYRASFGMADFIVYSYDTPIAWHTDRPHELAPHLIESWLDGTGDGVWVMPDVKYTVTTTKHQGDVRCALGGLVGGWWANGGADRLPEIPYVTLTLAGAPAKVEHVGCSREVY